MKEEKIDRDSSHGAAYVSTIVEVGDNNSVQRIVKREQRDEMEDPMMSGGGNSSHDLSHEEISHNNQKYHDNSRMMMGVDEFTGEPYSKYNDEEEEEANDSKFDISGDKMKAVNDEDVGETAIGTGKFDIASGIKVVDDAGTNLSRAVMSLNKCEMLLMSVSGEVNDKAIVAFMCKIKAIKSSLDNLLTEFTNLRPSYLSAVGAIKHENLMPQIMLDLVKTELDDDYEYDASLAGAVTVVFDEDVEADDNEDEDEDFIPPKSSRKKKMKSSDDIMRKKKRIKKFCEVCDISFPTLENFKAHLKECKRERTLKCEYCDEFFLSKRTLRIHKSKQHKMDIKHVCGVCNLEFETKKDLSKHKNQENHKGNEQKVHCDKCNKVLMSMKSYQEHVNNYHNRGHKCDVCPEAFDTSKELRDHLRIEHDVRPIHPCASCGEAFNSITELHKHLNESAHSNFTCEVCSKAFNSEITLRSHVKNLHSKSIPCETCGESFDGKMALKRHQTRKHLMQDNQFVCPECGFTTKSRAYFKHHVTIHGAKRHKCEHCEKAFHSKNDLKIHIRVHTGEKPYVCQICGARFRNNGGLSRHKLVHTGAKPFVCYLCGKGFNQKGNLKTHMKSHISGTQRLHHPPEIKEDI